MALDWTALAMFILPGTLRARDKPAYLQLVTNSDASDPAAVATLTATDSTTGETASQTLTTKTLIPATDAMSRFAAMMADEWAGETFQFKHVMAAYNEFADSHHWPAVTNKALSLALKRYGCCSCTGKRQKDGSRPSMITFPAKSKRRGRRK